MALTASNAYVRVSRSDEGFLNLVKSFFGKSNITEEVDDIWAYLNANVNNLGSRLTAGSTSISTWFRAVGNGNIEAWSDTAGWARFLMWSYIRDKGLLNHMYYSFNVEIVDAICLQAGQLQTMLALVDVPVTQSSPFEYKVSRRDAETVANYIGGDIRHLTDLAFCVGNYLGRKPTREELTGEVTLPVAAVRNLIEYSPPVSDAVKAEISLARLNLRGETKRKSPVEGVRFKLWEKELRAVADLLFDKELIEDVIAQDGVKMVILEAIDKVGVSFSTFEDRVESFLSASAEARNRLNGLVKFKLPTSLNVALKESVVNHDEIFKGDVRALLPRKQPKWLNETLMRVGSKFSSDEYSELTRRLVYALSVQNPHVEANYVESVIIILKRYIHYRTNALRFRNLPTKIEFEKEGKRFVVDYSGVDEVFAAQVNAIPEIERAWCAPLATVAYFLLKDEGGSFAKWSDLSHLPSHMNFDFVGYVDPRAMSAADREDQTAILARFKTKQTLVRGFGVGSRLINPIDDVMERLSISKKEKDKLGKLIR